MNQSVSGDYALPSPAACVAGNGVLRAARWVPQFVLGRVVRGHSSYQVSDEREIAGYQGVSAKKLQRLPLPKTLKGRSVLDLGCAEGFFARECAKRGASPVVAVDSSLSRLLFGSYMAVRDGLRVQFRMHVFPDVGVSRRFDYVLCLSLLHHSLTQKNVWRVLTDREFVEDALRLRRQLEYLRSVTAAGGKCIIEMPYEYENPELERRSVDFDVLTQEIERSGFARGVCLGSWDYNPSHRDFKDRILYLCEA